MEGKRQLEKRDFGKRLSLDSSLVEYMDSNKYIEHLVTQLEEQHRSLWREKLAVARLQREVAQRRSEGAMHEKLIHELEEERHLRLQSEKRLQEVTLESERNRIQMRGLQQQFSRMEETVRNLLQSQGPTEQKKEETVSIMVYQEKLSEDERKHKEALEDLHMVVDEDSRSESSSADEGKGKTKLLLERLKALEVRNEIIFTNLKKKNNVLLLSVALVLSKYKPSFLISLSSHRLIASSVPHFDYFVYDELLLISCNAQRES
uniref:NCK associated protein 5 n=1 Tax=Rousettus aegyptiacus TaxID=9407 RepID=A0A7J8JIE2_ROUAE|nr:NCK associated protein 5 [Rousettus aegyptiacus]